MQCHAGRTGNGAGNSALLLGMALGTRVESASTLEMNGMSVMIAMPRERCSCDVAFGHLFCGDLRVDGRFGPRS